jgi:hypothetical protein
LTILDACSIKDLAAQAVNENERPLGARSTIVEAYIFQPMMVSLLLASGAATPFVRA